LIGDMSRMRRSRARSRNAHVRLWLPPPGCAMQIKKQETQKWFVDKYEGILLN